MRITSKGQVTIPKNIRERLGVMPGDDVVFIEKEDHVELATLPAEETSETQAQRLQETLKVVAGTVDLNGQTTDEYMQTIRGGHEELDTR